MFLVDGLYERGDFYHTTTLRGEMALSVFKSLRMAIVGEVNHAKLAWFTANIIASQRILLALPQGNVLAYEVRACPQRRASNLQACCLIDTLT